MVYSGAQALIVGVRALPATYQLTQLTALHELRDAGYYIGDAIIQTVLHDIGEK